MPIDRTAVGYCRRSTDRQEQSIADQRLAIERYCAEHGLSLVRWHVDDAISGTKATNRPAFQAMVDAAQSPARDFSLVVVYDVKRFGRLDNDEAGFYRHTLRRCGVGVLYVAEGFAGLGESSDTDDLLRPVKQWQARQESKDLSKVTIRGLLSKADTGRWMGGVAPHGYDIRYTNDRGEFLFVIRFMPDGTKQQLDGCGGLVRTLERGERISISKRDSGSLVLGHPERVETIRTIFRLYTEERRGLTAVSAYLNEHNVPTPRGPAWSHIYCGEWRDSTVRSILINPLYSGDMVWNRRTDARFHRIEHVNGHGRPVERRDPHGARLVPNDKRDWVIVRDTHEAIVPRRTWELAQEIRQGKPASSSQVSGGRPVGGWQGMRARFLLSGLVRCERCGGRYQGVTRSSGKRRPDGTRYKHRYYGCGSYVAKGRSACAFGPVDQDRLEAAVVDTVIKFYQERYGGADGHKQLAAAVRDHLGHESADIAEAGRRLERDRERIDQKIETLLDNLSDKTRELVEERLVQLRDDRDRLKTRADELERLALRDAEVHDLVLELRGFLAALEGSLRVGPNEQRVAALRRCVGSVLISAPQSPIDVFIRGLPMAGVLAPTVHLEAACL